ncbi:hypothetical protein F4810DRAFT_671357 [Camillea tinctor]|nr:hypothetical protein F4810DRAFT_671357 [Camillea tinctor]
MIVSRLGPNRSVHHAGTWLLLIATIMHLIPVLTIPVTKMDILKVENRNVSLGGGYPVVRMGTFGYCVSVEDGPESDKPEVCHQEWAYDIDHLTWTPGTEFSLRTGSNSTNTTTADSTKDKRAEDSSDKNDDSGIELPSYMSAMTGLMAALNAFSFALCTIAFLVSLTISMCFLSSSYVVTWVVSAVAAVGTTAAAAADYRWAAYARHAGAVRYGIGAACLSVALVIQAVVFVSGLVVCCLERRRNETPAAAAGGRKKDRSSERMKKIDDDRLYDDESLDGEDTSYRPPRAANGYSNV